MRKESPFWLWDQTVPSSLFRYFLPHQLSHRQLHLLHRHIQSQQRRTLQTLLLRLHLNFDLSRRCLACNRTNQPWNRFQLTQLRGRLMLVMLSLGPWDIPSRREVPLFRLPHLYRLASASLQTSRSMYRQAQFHNIQATAARTVSMDLVADNDNPPDHAHGLIVFVMI